MHPPCTNLRCRSDFSPPFGGGRQPDALLLLDLQFLLHLVQVDRQHPAGSPPGVAGRGPRFQPARAECIRPAQISAAAPIFLRLSAAGISRMHCCYLICSSFSTSFRLIVSIRLAPHPAGPGGGPAFILLGRSESALRKSPLPLRFFSTFRRWASAGCLSLT